MRQKDTTAVAGTNQGARNVGFWKLQTAIAVAKNHDGVLPAGRNLILARARIFARDKACPIDDTTESCGILRLKLKAV